MIDLPLVLRQLLRGSDADVVATAREARAAWPDLVACLTPALHPLLHDRLRAAGVLPSLPADIVASLSRSRQAAAMAEMQRRSVVRPVSSALAAADISVVALKGSALAYDVYPDPALRPMTDIDLWVRPEQIDAAVATLLSGGFDVPPAVLADGRVSARLDQRRLRSTTTHVLVELHGHVRSLAPLSSAWLDEAWARAVERDVAGVVMRVLAPNDQLIHHCLHVAMTDRFASAQLALFDTALFLDRREHEIDWNRLASDVASCGAGVYVALALSMARRVWNAHVPDDYLEDATHAPGFDVLDALAYEQTWVRDTALPAAVELVLRESGLAARGRAFVTQVLLPRVHVSGSTRGARNGVSLVSGFAADLRYRVPRYVRALFGGDLSPREFRRRSKLARRRGEIGRIADAMRRSSRAGSQGAGARERASTR